MINTLEQRLKQHIGELVFVNHELQRQLEEAQERLKALEPKEQDKPQLHAVE
jgi:regulator of replication initiation timing